MDFDVILMDKQLHIQEYMRLYRDQLRIGAIQKAYSRIMLVFAHLQKAITDIESGKVSSLRNSGIFEETYFTFIPHYLVSGQLKYVVVFNHTQFNFTIYLSGRNKGITAQFKEQLERANWQGSGTNRKSKSGFSIIESILIENPDFSNIEELTSKLIREIKKFTIVTKEFLTIR